MNWRGMRTGRVRPVRTSIAEKEELVASFPRLSREMKGILLTRTKGRGVLLLRLRMLSLLTSYEKLTVRMLFYRCVSMYNYPNSKNFYKRLQYSLKAVRKLFPEVGLKFEDPTRQVSAPPIPRPKIELWLEKASLEFYLGKVAERYHVPTLSSRGFGSVTMFIKAIERARRRGVVRILLISDHDPSGLLIAEVTKREMPVRVKRIALTMEQIKRYGLPSIRVKRSDSRAKKYIEKFGDRAWEVEALPPRTLLHIVEEELKRNITPGLLKEVRLSEEALRVTSRLEGEVGEWLREKAAAMLKGGGGREEARRRLKAMLKGLIEESEASRPG